MSPARLASPPALAVLVLASLTAACMDPLEGSAIYADTGEHKLVCGLNILSERKDAKDLDKALDRALEEGSIVQFYDHAPKPDGPSHTSRIEALIADTAERGMPFVTYREMADQEAAGSSLALSFDDTFVNEWYALRPIFKRYRARVTFFVTRFHDIDDEHRAMLKTLEDEGHDIEYHGVNHAHSVRYVDEHGMDAFLANEIEPDLALMREAGFDPVAFAYPFSERRGDIDAALGRTFKLLRGNAWHCD